MKYELSIESSVGPICFTFSTIHIDFFETLQLASDYIETKILGIEQQIELKNSEN